MKLRALNALVLALTLSTPQVATAQTQTATAKPSFRAPNLAILLQDDQPLCYDAVVTVNDKTDAAQEKKMEARLSSLLKGLGLKATEFDAADACARVLGYNIEIDNKGAPGLFNAELFLDTLNAYDDDTDLNLATVWNMGRWGGTKGTYTTTEIGKRIDETLTTLLENFKADFTSVKTGR